MEVVVSSSGRSLLFATMVPLLRVYGIDQDCVYCVLMAIRKHIGKRMLAPGWDTRYNDGSSAGTDIKDVNAFRTSCFF